MMKRAWALGLGVILPGLFFAGISTYYLFPEWAALDASHRQFSQLARQPNSTLNQLFVAQAAENRHRLNCFAEGVGVLGGGVMVAIGIQGLCLLPRQSRSGYLL
jgi:hypothetical protein